MSRMPTGEAPVERVSGAPTLGHNGGPPFAPGLGRVHAWRRARRALLPMLPLEVVRLRVARARALGLDYGTYATVRASTGRDVTAFLFSSNALRLFPARPEPQGEPRARLAASAAVRLLAAHAPLAPDDCARRAAASGLPFAAAGAAPRFTDAPREMRLRLEALVRDARQPRDAILVIGDTAFERGWSPAARLAGYLPAERWLSPT